MALLNENKILFTSIPKHNDVKYFIAIIDPSRTRDESATTDFQWQVLKTRYLIWRTPELIAAPVLYQTSKIHMILSSAYVFEGNLTKMAQEHGLIISGPHDLTDQVYYECIKYSITFRIAPQWNKLEETFVHSSEFLTDTEPMDSVLMETHVADSRLALSLRSLRVRLPALNLLDLGVDLGLLRSTGKVLVNQVVYVLPQLRRGTAVSVSTYIPQTCPFTSYLQLRRHWKNTHGYRLPHDPQDMLYVQIRFRWSCDAYTYPMMCVRPCGLVRLRCRTDLYVISTFVNDVLSKFPNICGHPVDLKLAEGNVYHPVASLGSASNANPHANLTPVAIEEPLTQPFSLVSRTQTSASSGLTSPPSKKLTRQSRSPPLFLITAAPPRVQTPTPPPAPKLFPIFKLKTTTTTSFQSGQSAQLQKALQRDATAGVPQGSIPAPLLLTFAKQGNHPNKKPKPSLDIEALAKSRNLQRASVPLLIEFCKANGIPTKSKEKKEIIMKKVYDFCTV